MIGQGYFQEVSLKKLGFEDFEETRDCIGVGQIALEETSSIIIPKIFPTVASVILNGNLLWVTGGPIRYNCTTSFLFHKVPEIPIKFPRYISCHSMVQVDPKTLFIIGGDDTGSIGSNTWIIDPTNNFSIKIGPRLRNIRNTHSCSKMKINGKWFLVVAGGIENPRSLRQEIVGDNFYTWPKPTWTTDEYIDRVELLDTSSPNQHFTEGIFRPKCIIQLSISKMHFDQLPI